MDSAGALEALADLTREADDALPKGAAEAAQAAAEAESAKNVRAIVGALKGGRKLAEPRFRWWRDFSEVWSDDQLQAIAQALEAVRLHMGWGVDELMGKWGPWLALALAAGVPAWATFEAIEARREALAHARAHPPQPVPPT